MLKHLTKIPQEHPHIVIYTRSLANGGLERVAAQTSQALARSGYSVTLVYQYKLPIHYEYSGKLMYDNINNPGLKKILAEASCIIDFSWKDNGLPAFLRYILHRSPDKFIATAHNTETIGYYLEDLHKHLGGLDTVAAVVCVSKAVQKTVLERYGPLSNTTVIHNTFQRKASNELSDNRTRPFFIFVGRLDAVEQKGLDVLFQAWRTSSVKAEYDLLLIGSGTPPAELLNTVEDVHDTIHFMPFCEDIYCWMEKARALVLPSRWEGFGLVLAEALSCGTPCITTKCGGPEEIVIHGQNGLLVDIGDVGALSSALEQTADDPRLYKTLCDNSKKSVEGFSFPNFCRKWSELTAEITGLSPTVSQQPSAGRNATAPNSTHWNIAEEDRRKIAAALLSV